MRIELVMIAGRLYGKTASDRWNLSWFKVGVRGLAYDRNQRAIKKLRRLGFVVTVDTKDSMVPITQAELDMFTPAADVAVAA